ncbi:nitrate/nitrite transporter NrtS [bacterium SCSIO 12696]|nr:nitrate/nitrite transporter NrtS [bacterium SCSIO 12696]
MPSTPDSFISLAISKKVVFSALKVSAIVGTALALINHGSALIKAAADAEVAIKIALTYLVPYCVSTYASVKAIQDCDGH